MRGRRVVVAFARIDVLDAVSCGVGTLACDRTITGMAVTGWPDRLMG
jgi:hypothetical protein